jgi:hypothetical protein
VQKKIFAIAILLQMDLSPANAQAGKISTETTNQLVVESAIDKRVFKLYKPWVEQSAPLYNDTTRMANQRSSTMPVVRLPPDDLYWIRIKTDGIARWEFESASYESLVPRSPNEEVIVVSPRRLAYHPAWNRRNDGKAPNQRSCTADEVKSLGRYSACNSSFATLTPGSAVLGILFQAGGGERTTYSFSPANLEAAIVQIDLDRAIRSAEAENVKHKMQLAASQESQRRVDALERQRREAADDRERLAKRKADDAVFESVAKYPVGFKDVCATPEYDRYSQAQTKAPIDPPLACQNMSEIPSLARLKAAGYIVTNVSKSVRGNDGGMSGEVWSWQYNVERFDLKK